MVRLEVQGKSGRIESFRVRGHAGYAEEGSDIVCASVSALVYNAINSCERFAGVVLDVKDKPNELVCRVPSGDSTQGVQLLLNSMVFGIEQIRDQYPEYLQIRTVAT